jgi:hypothetical protein
MSKGLIYLLGAFTFGLAYPFLERILSGPVLFVAAVLCAIAFRLLAETYGKK